MNDKIVYLLVSVRVSPDTSAVNVRNYVREAVEASGGCRHPNDEFFSMRNRVAVSFAPKPVNKSTK